MKLMNFIQQAASKVSGTLCGAVTGLAAGFIPGFYCVDGSAGGIAPGILYLTILPFSILYHIARGAIEGARGGFIAGVSYPKTVNDMYQVELHNEKVSYLLDSYLNKKDSFSVLLTEKEEQELNNLIKQQTSPEKRQVLEGDFAAYQQYISKTKCVITGRALKEIEKPLFLEINNQVAVCETSAFNQLVTHCRQNQIPITLEKMAKPASKDIIGEEHVIEFTINTLPIKVANFIKHARKLLTSMHLIHETLGIESIPTMTTSATSEDLSKTNNKLHEQSPAIANSHIFATTATKTGRGHDGQIPVIQQEQLARQSKNNRL